MLLRDYIRSLPKGERGAFRLRLAAAHGVSVALVRKWENDPAPDEWSADKKRAEVRRHPSELKAIEVTERLTDHRVTRLDLRPECWTMEIETV